MPRLDRYGKKYRVVECRIQIPVLADTGYPKYGRKEIRGKNIPVTITMLLAGLFKCNEWKTRKEKMTDEMIKRIVLREFPNTKSAKNLIEGKCTIGWWRQKYNRGSLTRGEIPSQVSRRYNEYGEIVNPRNGKQLTDERKQALRRKYGESYC